MWFPLQSLQFRVSVIMIINCNHVDNSNHENDANIMVIMITMTATAMANKEMIK